MTTVVLEHLQHANSGGPDLTIDANGFIGVGTASPVRPLSVVATGNTTSVFERTDGVYVLEMKGSGTTSPAALGMSGNDLVALVNNSERLRVDATGNVGIGTNSPTTSSRLHVTDSDVQIALEATGGSNKGYINFDGTSLQMSTNRDLKTGGFANSEKSNATMMMRGLSGGSEFRFYTTASNNTTATNRMTITKEGFVTTPNNPAFDAYYTSNATWSIGANNTLVFNATTFNQGGHYSTSNGRFTAPVSGVYHFTYYSIYIGNYNNGDLNLYVNGVRTNGTDRHFTANEGSNWNTIAGANTRYLNAGDYVMVYSRSGASFHGGYWSNFSGHLVG